LGASADVMSFGLKKVDTGLTREIWQEWPDVNFLARVKELLKGERTRAPRTRPGVLARSGMPYLLRSSRLFVPALSDTGSDSGSDAEA
jgi:hypothetical protein